MKNKKQLTLADVFPINTTGKPRNSPEYAEQYESFWMLNFRRKWPKPVNSFLEYLPIELCTEKGEQ